MIAMLAFTSGYGGAAQGYGLVTGLAAPCVGVAPRGGESVTVYARHNGKVVKSDRVLLTRSPDNPYRLMLPGGQYVISAPRSDLPGRTVSVRPHTTVRVNFLPTCK